jgi:hypothetical protein
VKKRMGGHATVAPAIVAAIVVLAVAGCGSKASPPKASPTPSASRASLATQLAAVTGYLSQVKPIASQVGTTVGSLPGAVKGIHKKPDATWKASAAKLHEIAARLGSEATGLAALTPPPILQPAQEAAVKGIRDAQATVAKTADLLNKRTAKAAATQAKIQSRITTLQAQLAQLGQRLLSAIEAAVSSPNATPSP